MHALGTEFERDPQPTFETVTATNKTLLRVKQTGFQIEVFFLSDDEHDQQRFARRKHVPAVEFWCDRHSTRELLERLKRELGI